MRIRVLDGLLLIATIVGAVRLSDTTQTLHQLRNEYNRVVAYAGDMEIKDPDLLHIVALHSDDPWHFMWRVYVPANFNIPFHLDVGSSGGMSSSWNSGPTEFIARIRIKQNRAGQCELFKTFGSGSSLMSFGSPELMDFLNRHRHELKIEQAGVEGMQSINADTALTVLKISLPDELAAQAKREFKSYGDNYLFPVLVNARIGGK